MQGKRAASAANWTVIKANLASLVAFVDSLVLEHEVIGGEIIPVTLHRPCFLPYLTTVPIDLTRMRDWLRSSWPGKRYLG
jgi:hypothetical protein